MSTAARLSKAGTTAAAAALALLVAQSPAGATVGNVDAEITFNRGKATLNVLHGGGKDTECFATYGTDQGNGAVVFKARKRTAQAGVLAGSVSLGKAQEGAGAEGLCFDSSLDSPNYTEFAVAGEVTGAVGTPGGGLGAASVGDMEVEPVLQANGRAKITATYEGSLKTSCLFVVYLDLDWSGRLNGDESILQAKVVPGRKGTAKLTTEKLPVDANGLLIVEVTCVDADGSRSVMIPIDTID